MKIVHATPVYLPALGGVELYVQRIAEGMALRGHEVRVVTSDGNSPRLLANTAENLAPLEAVRISRSSSYRVFPGRQLSVSPKMAFDMAVVSADIIHAHVWGSFASDVANLIAKAKQTPIVVNPYYVPIGPQHDYGILARLWGRRRYEATRVIAISEKERDALIELGFDERLIEIVYPGVNLEEFEQPQPNILERYKLDQAPVVLYSGRVRRHKRIDLLIKSAPLILEHQPETRFLIVGPDEGELTTLKKLAASRGVGDFIIFAGPLSRRNLISAYQHSTVLVFPSHFEVFSIVTVEAMAARLPVVGCRQAIAHIVDEEETGLLFAPDNPEELAKCTVRLLGDIELRQRLARNAMRKVISKYTWKVSLEHLERIYRSLGPDGGK